jgi:hypothetical protein
LDVLEFQNVRVGEQQRMTDFFVVADKWKRSNERLCDCCTFAIHGERGNGKENWVSIVKSGWLPCETSWENSRLPKGMGRSSWRLETCCVHSITWMLQRVIR